MNIGTYIDWVIFLVSIGCTGCVIGDNGRVSFPNKPLDWWTILWGWGVLEIGTLLQVFSIIH